MERIEQTVRRNDARDEKNDRLKYKLCLFAAAAFSIFGITAVVFAFSLLKAVTIIPVIVFWGLAALFFFVKDNMCLEYDYTVEDDVFTVAKIKNLSSRKEILQIPVGNFRRLEVYTPEKASSFGKPVICSLNPQKKMLVFDENGVTRALVFEPNEEFTTQIERELKKQGQL